MKVIDVPIYNEDGSVRLTQHVTADEAQHLLGFALNFLVSTGLAAQMNVVIQDEDALEDFNPTETND